LKPYFAAIEVVAEKNAATYREMISRYDLPSELSWMIGNSPKSDINPALAVGMNAVFVPHGNTWVLEHEEVAQVQPPAQLLVVDQFSDLRQHF
jgi:putative hydrolase of the HAD superfamily